MIEAVGLHLVDAGRSVAVLAVDPSSPRGGGSILGDKTRMGELTKRSEAFVRPSPTGGTLGGVTRRTREAVLLCEAAGFDAVVVETVGVGQSEFAVEAMVDCFLLLISPGGGDELQGIKRGIMELADVVVVNKADGDLAAVASTTAADYANALRLVRPKTPAWQPEGACRAPRSRAPGIDEVWQAVADHHAALEAAGELATRRGEQARAWMWAEVSASLLERLRRDPHGRGDRPPARGRRGRGPAPCPGGRRPGAGGLPALGPERHFARCPQPGDSLLRSAPGPVDTSGGMGMEAVLALAFGAALGTFLTAAVLWLHERQQRKALQEVGVRLRRSEGRSQAMLRDSHDIIAVVDAQGRLTYASPAAERIFGRRVGPLLGSSPFDFVHVEDREQVLALLRRRDQPARRDRAHRAARAAPER